MLGIINLVLTADLFLNNISLSVCGPYCLKESCQVNSFISEKENWKRVFVFLYFVGEYVYYNLDDNKKP